MIHIDFNEPETEEWKNWRTKCEEEQQKHNEAVEAGIASEVKAKVYKAQKVAVYMDINGPFWGKCAYCEQKIYGDQHGDIEHFRPKGAVWDEHGKAILIQIDGQEQEQEHPGYYWLAYDWKNLLPSCILCNSPSSQHSGGRPIGKRNYFPVRGYRANRPGEEALEEPLLLHPVFDDPDQHLEIDSLGIFHSKTDCGESCINIFGLNERDLPNERKKKYDDVKLKVCALANFGTYNINSPETESLLNKLVEISKGVEEFTLAARKAIEDSKENLSYLLNAF